MLAAQLCNELNSLSTLRFDPTNPENTITSQEFDVEEWYYQARIRVYGIIAAWHIKKMKSRHIFLIIFKSSTHPVWFCDTTHNLEGSITYFSFVDFMNSYCSTMCWCNTVLLHSEIRWPQYVGHGSTVHGILLDHHDSVSELIDFRLRTRCIQTTRLWYIDLFCK